MEATARKFYIRTGVCLCLTSVILLGVASPRTTLVIGKVHHNPEQQYPRLQPIVEYVASHMKDLGITRGSTLIFKNNDELIQSLRDGKVDWVTESPVSAVLFSQKTGAEIILRKWKKGVPTYHSVFFVRRDSGIHSLKNLQGKKIAFGDPGSTSSYYLPTYQLKKKGYELVELSSIRETPPADKVGYAFTGGKEVNIFGWVYLGLAEIGVFSNLDWDNPKDVPVKFKKELKVIHRTQPVPRAVELLRKDLNPRLKQRIREILLQAHKNPRGQKALKAYNKTLKFDEFNGEALEGLDLTRKILKFIQTQNKSWTKPVLNETEITK